MTQVLSIAGATAYRLCEQRILTDRRACEQDARGLNALPFYTRCGDGEAAKSFTFALP